MPCASTTRASDIAGFSQGGTQALAGQFEQAKAADLAGLYSRAIVMQRITQAVFNFALIFCGFHINEVDDNQPA